MKCQSSQPNQERKYRQQQAEVTKIYSGHESSPVRETVKKEKGICTSFDVSPQTAEVTATMHDDHLTRTENTVRLWVQDRNGKHSPLTATCCFRKHRASTKTSARSLLNGVTPSQVTQIQEQAQTKKHKNHQSSYVCRKSPHFQEQKELIEERKDCHITFIIVQLQFFYCIIVCMCAQSCPTLCNPTGCGPPSSSVCGIFQARILEQIAISSSRGSR